MPRTGSSSSRHFRIVITDLKRQYYPGDTISGYVHFHPSQFNHTVTRSQNWNACIRIKLFGRAKTKIIVKTQNGTNISRGRAVFFEEVKILCKGDVRGMKAPNGTGDQIVKMDFSFTIPKTSQPRLEGRGDGWKKVGGSKCLSSREKDGVDVTTHKLPSVLYYQSESSMGSTTCEAYIEYALVAENLYNNTRATMPLYVRAISSDKPLHTTLMKPLSKFSTLEIRTHKLLPEFADGKLNFSQHCQRFFQPSKTPKYTYKVYFETSSILQLEHPDPLPLKVLIIPDLDPQRTTICPDGDLTRLPTVSIIGMSIKLTASVEMRISSSLSSDETKTHNYPVHISSAPFFKHSDGKICGAIPIPVGAPHSFTSQELFAMYGGGTPQAKEAVKNSIAQAGVEPLDLGKALDVKFTESGSSSATSLESNNGNRRNTFFKFKRTLHPSFSTYNIAVSYVLVWEMRIMCMGEQSTVSGSTPITVLPPSEEQEAIKQAKLGTDGMQKNNDDFFAAAETGMGVANTVIQAVAAF